jgi:HK97 family phage portal protein
MPNAEHTTVRGRLAASAARLLSTLAPPFAHRRGETRRAGLHEGIVARPVHHPATTKSSAAGPLIAFQSLRQPVWTPRDYTAFAREGYAQNAIVYRCVRMIAEAAAGVPLLLYDGDSEITAHPLLDLVTRPNPVQAGPDLLESFFGNLLVSGNAYCEAVAVDGAIRELHVLRPDRVKVVPGPDGWPEAWEYTVGGRTVRISGEPAANIRPVLHMRLYHPDSDHYGMSPLEPAASAIDLHNTAARWNKALLDNSARPSGALVYTARDGNLSAEQYERLKSELEEGFQGSANAGRPLLLEGGLDWKSMSLSPKDLDFIEARHAASREIALALGVPPMLLGIPGDNTYSNLAEAQRIFWRQTVLPLVNRLASALSGWLAPAYAEAPARALRFVPDTDALEALSSEREALWARLERTSFLTLNEKRAAAGYGPVSGGDGLEAATRPRAEALKSLSGGQEVSPQ